MTGGWHLEDAGLFACYVADRGGEPLAPVAAGHLAACDACRTRLAEFRKMMDMAREAAAAESDAVFTPVRLEAQRRQVARRLVRAGHVARVLTFPRTFVARTGIASANHPAPRWLAASAAAGLFVGVALGATYSNDAQRQPSVAHHTVPNRAIPGPGRPVERSGAEATSGAAADAATVEAFLLDLDDAVDRPRFQELQAIDALTPHVREVHESVQVR